ncbi:MAG: aminotransferase class I/II-fold pyridoxal phosphate-dependent enzyme [Desulfobacterales bacterium]|nr:aminotransferase class I/II-fold pyridoxal phosphate-dependent enzyme [Desulfobacterales bacterium]
MAFDPSNKIQDLLNFGEFGGVNPSITDSATYTFMNLDTMKEAFDHEMEGCFLYSRHWNPINKFLSKALAQLEDSESALVTASGMAAISCTLLQICSAGDEILAHRTIYGGTYALMKNFLPRLGIQARFVNMLDVDAVQNAITKQTRVLYCESLSNPLIEVADIAALRSIADNHHLRLIVDNTFSPMVVSPIRLGAHAVIHSLTKFINGTSDCVAGCICASKDFIDALTNVNSGASMLLGPVLDSFRTASILKNIHSLHIRMQKHSANAQFLSEQFEKLGFRVFYPGLASSDQHGRMQRIMNPGFGYGGMLSVDFADAEKASRLMAAMQKAMVGYLAVSLGYFKTLFSSPGNSTSSEIPKKEQAAIGLSEGLIRFSVGLDNDIKRSFERMKKCLHEVDLV